MKISLKVRLAFWYSLIVGVSLSAFGLFTYFLVSNELNQSLDSSLKKVSESLNYILNQSQDEIEKQKEKPQRIAKANKKDKFAVFRESEKREFVGPVLGKPSEADIQSGLFDENNPVLTAVYEHILLNTKNYFIQIADTNLQIVWKTKNLKSNTLPFLQNTQLFFEEERSIPDSIVQQAKSTFQEYSEGSFENIYIENQKVRLFVKNTSQAIISVGYSIEDIENTLNGLFSILLYAFPIILIISAIGGLVLSKLSLRAIDEIAVNAEEITASNLSRRLPEPHTNDEVGHLTRTLNKMIERLERSFIQIRQFTSDASHELKTPLTILRGELELALRTPKKPEQYQLVLASALEETERLSNVVETLLELSKADAGQVKMTFQEQNISKLITDISEDADILAEQKKIRVEKKIPNTVIACFDSARMHQAVLNIVDNAIKYTNEFGKISIELSEEEKYAVLKVTDTGTGVPKNFLPYLFDRFYRVDRARSQETRGAGLGLSIVKWIIDAHQGIIDVKSQLYYGTAFTIKIPKKRERKDDEMEKSSKFY
ncbi:MAG: HAMP domain-containing protein [Ignavibacteria bacterium]|nr:HAMP domain-containing protein [Ignavibacteria bacterium]